MDSLIGNNAKTIIESALLEDKPVKIIRRYLKSKNCPTIQIQQTETSVFYFTDPIVVSNDSGDMFAFIIESFEGETIYCIYSQTESGIWKKIHKTLISIE